MAGSQRLHVDTSGRVTGPARVQYNDPFPTRNHGEPSGVMRGVIMHTMVGNLPGTITEFNTASSKASAHFGIDQTGLIHQFIPVGKGLYSWAQVAGNPMWYSVECADNGNPRNPLTGPQLLAFAQLAELLSSFASFPLDIADQTTGRGLGVHSMGGQAWGGHPCPDTDAGHPVRSAQRPVILAAARSIRAGVTPSVNPPSAHSADGKTSLRQFAALHGVTVDQVVYLTARARAGTAFGVLQAKYVDGGAWGLPMPAGMSVWAP